MNKKFFPALLVSCLIILFVLGLSSQKEKIPSEETSKIVCLETYKNGSIMSINDFRSETQGVVFFTDGRWRYSEGELFGRFFDQYDSNLPCLKFRKLDSVLNVLWEVDGFGKTVLRMNLSNLENMSALKFEKELAEQKLRTLEGEFERYEDLYDLSQLEGYIERSKSFMNSDNYQKSLNNSLRGLEKYTMIKSRRDIEDFRKSNFTVRVVESENKPLSNANISYKLLKSDFSFGWFGDLENSVLSDKMETLGFNTAQNFAFWHEIEPHNNSRNFYPLKGLGELQGFDIGISGLIGDSPPYLADLSEYKLEEEVKYHTTNLVNEIESKFDVEYWECYGLGMNYWADKSLQMTSNRSKYVNVMSTINCVNSIQNNSDGRVIITGWNIDGSEIRNRTYSESPYEYYENLDNLNFDIGFDFMYFGGAHEIYPELIEKEVYKNDVVSGKNWVPARHLYSISEMLDWYSNLNRSIHIQYFQAPSNSLENQQGYWRSSWNEKIQSDWIEKYYTLIYGKPYVESINYLEPMDSEWKDFKTGILYRNGTLKRSYYTLKDLLRKWKSEGELVTDERGRANFRGYEGVYKIKVENRSYEREVDISEVENITLHLG